MPLRNQLFAIFLCASSSVAQTPAIHLAGAPNFRDIGGLATADGHTVRSGRFYRSGQLAALTGDDYATLSALGIRAVFDLRTEGERAESATRWTGSPTPETIGTPIVFGTVPGNLPLADLLRALASKLKTEDDARNLMIGGMAGIAESGRIQIGRVITRLSEGTEPAIVHCTAGKDRTRLLTAVLLTISAFPTTGSWRTICAAMPRWPSARRCLRVRQCRSIRKSSAL